MEDLITYLNQMKIELSAEAAKFIEEGKVEEAKVLLKEIQEIDIKIGSRIGDVIDGI